MPCGPLMPPISPMEAPDGALFEAGAPGCAGAPARKSSDSCLCFAAASWPLVPIPPPSPPRPAWNWLASPPLTSPGSEELMSSSGRSCSRSKSVPKSRHKKENRKGKQILPMRTDGGSFTYKCLILPLCLKTNAALSAGPVSWASVCGSVGLHT